jgi:hypothetical protein
MSGKHIGSHEQFAPGSEIKIKSQYDRQREALVATLAVKLLRGRADQKPIYNHDSKTFGEIAVAEAKYILKLVENG